MRVDGVPAGAVHLADDAQVHPLALVGKGLVALDVLE